jgi:molybdenum cofactor biosynthesis enzyme MoaA
MIGLLELVVRLSHYFLKMDGVQKVRLTGKC